MKKVFYVLFFLILAHSGKVLAQAGDYKFHTMYIYNFTRYIQWPNNYQSGDFVIGVLGTSPITAQLKAIAMKKMVGTQKIVVKNYRTVAMIDNCHMIFIPNAESKNLNTVKEKVKGKSTLIITERNGLANQGSGINFVLQNGKWKFELNTSEVNRRSLKVSSQLMRLAIPTQD
jgi:hypothetical protein